MATKREFYFQAGYRAGLAHWKNNDVYLAADRAFDRTGWGKRCYDGFTDGFLAGVRDRVDDGN